MPVFHRLAFCLCLSAGLFSGCAFTRPVSVVDAAAFARMARQMPGELQARGLLDSGGSYRPSLFPAPSLAYGDILFRRLSPSFMHQPDTLHDIYLGETFAATLQPDSRLTRRPNGFQIRHASQTVDVDMLAVADWNGDGTDEWIASCRVEPRRGGRTRTYYVLIPPPGAGGRPVRGTLAAIYECLGLACSLYVRDSRVIARDAADPSLPPTEVQDLLPGLQTVTTPPGAGASPPAGKGGVEERDL